jgi:diaminohydroxyphosphoribosylaminopyrimidine deaminase/5-amino-6-(5-phosphoribosylamino)uracil reductase
MNRPVVCPMRNPSSGSRDISLMRLALALARKGLGRTSPNPAVGAVVAKNGRVLATGWHKRAGLPHAEIEALRNAGKNARGASLYVTLEPCVHWGKTPPCVEEIIEAGIKRVFVGTKDPNPLVKGRGLKKLAAAGVEVSCGILEEDCRRLNEAYNKHITTGVPFVTLKLASTLDGRIATAAGESRWITSLHARTLVHRLRTMVDCVMVGSGTVVKDDPSLTVRHVRGAGPARAVVDSALKAPPDARIFLSPTGKVFVFTGKKASQKKVSAIEKKGAEVIRVPYNEEGLRLKSVLRELGKRGVASVMLEGGARLAASALKEGAADRVIVFVSPKILGSDAHPAVAELGIRRLRDALKLKEVKIKMLDGEVVVEGYLQRRIIPR